MLTLSFDPLYIRPIFMKWRQLTLGGWISPFRNHVLLIIFVYASYVVTNNLLFLPRFEEGRFFKGKQGTTKNVSKDLVLKLNIKIWGYDFASCKLILASWKKRLDLILFKFYSKNIIRSFFFARKPSWTTNLIKIFESNVANIEANYLLTTKLKDL